MVAAVFSDAEARTKIFHHPKGTRTISMKNIIIGSMLGAAVGFGISYLLRCTGGT